MDIGAGSLLDDEGSSALGSSATRAVGTTDGVFTAAEAEAFLAAHALTVTTGKL